MWNDEDLSQSALTEAHGDCAGGENGTWEAQVGKRRQFLIAGKNPLRRKGLEALDHMENGKTVAKVLKAKGGTRAPKSAVYKGHPWVVSGFGLNLAFPFNT